MCADDARGAASPGRRRPGRSAVSLDIPNDGSVPFTAFKGQCRSLLQPGATRVCDVGGGRTPVFGLDEVDDLGLDYTVLDISQAELDLAPAGYRTLCADIGGEAAPVPERAFDLVFSHTVAEHVANARRMHENIFRMLAPGGIAFHSFPTLFWPPFVVNRILPESLTSNLLAMLQPNRPRDEKFPALYRMCYGPTPRMRRFVETVGFEVVEHRPFYGTAYFWRYPGLRDLERWTSNWAASRRSTLFTSYAWLTLRRPADRAEPPSPELA
jgi:SAM-dependent methyltransferase